ncbi:g8638 [Coccomyxa viridis]|uniref:G8638 protein n=1 Tax=Coccomyxa viridis TaxID=1274662 RepID=A0ABP1G3G0_9CHLO
MITVDTRPGAIVLLVFALILLGTWGPLLNLAERRGRHTVHTYMDFSIGFVLVSIVCGLTLGELGGTEHGENFFYQLQHSSEKRSSIGFAMASGFCIFFGNLAEQYALALAGVTIAVPMFSSCIVVLGTVLNYFADSGLNKATILFPGVACFAMAVIAGASTHIFNEQYLGRRKRLLDASHHGHAVGNAVVGFEHGAADKSLEEGRGKNLNDSAHGTAPVLKDKDAEKQTTLPDERTEKKYEMADVDSTMRSVHTTSRTRIMWGIGIAIVGGLVGALFSPGFNVTTNDTFHLLPPGVKPLTVYTGYFWFCVMYFFLALVVTQIMMRFPPLGQPRSNWVAWAKDRTWLSLIGFTSGVLVSIANVLQFLGGQAAGYAASDMVQANPIVSTFWGILFFREYRRSSPQAYTCLVAMYCFFIAAVALLAASAQVRPGQ